MPRYKLTLEYDGTPFVGWQRQDNGLSVQQVLEEAVKAFCGEDVTVFGSGRTDAGVHAIGQVAHITLSKTHPADTVRRALNQHLIPHLVAVLDAEDVADDFHARFSAESRSYRYRIVNRRARLALDRNRAWHVPLPLDADAMHEAAQSLLGKHDFTTFRSVKCQARSPVKTLDEISVERRAEEVWLYTRAQSFMHNQVRAMVGSLKMVGEGKWPVGQIAEALAACERTACGPTAPACGLYFDTVTFGARRYGPDGKTD
jgi:tRNA pseudouridine38-40 synthase